MTAADPRQARDPALLAYAQGTIVTLRAERDRYRGEVARLREALEQFHAWADGFLHPTTGMGAGMHVEMWPTLGPMAAKRMAEIARAALAPAPGSGEEPTREPDWRALAGRLAHQYLTLMAMEGYDPDAEDAQHGHALDDYDRAEAAARGGE